VTLLTPTLAQSQATQNYASNLNTLKNTQPKLRQLLIDCSQNIEWILGRDHALTGIDEFGDWISGCSLPRRAAEAMLAKLELHGSVACFLAPAHAAQLRTALKILRPQQAIIAIIPDLHDLSLILHCDNFTADIQSHRLWLTAGENWMADLQNLFDQHIGLPTPTQFIRPPDADAELIDSLISTGQTIFTNVGTGRSVTMQSLRDASPRTLSTKNRLCAVAPSQFRLWNDIGDAILRALGDQNDFEILHYDSDNPTRSSPLALLQAASQCNAIFTANTSRADLPGVIPETIPWITWCTSAKIPSSVLSNDNDHLIVIDPNLAEIARKSGWRNVHVGGWPAQIEIAATPSRSLALIADTFSLETPDDLKEYSSHGLLWEAIRHELLQNPFVLSEAGAFLSDRMQRLGVSEDNLSPNRFIDRLILPAYQQGLARLLIKAKLPLRLHGKGWEEIPEFKSYAAGAIQNRQEFQQILSESAAVVHAWPSTLAHPIDAINRPIVRRRDHKPQTFIRDAQSAITGKLALSTSKIPALSSNLIAPLISSLGL
jgi:hypothetical protein